MANGGQKLVLLLLSFCLLLIDYSYFASGRDTIGPGQRLEYQEHLSSGNFILGFFFTSDYNGSYLGIWYNYANRKEEEVLFQTSQTEIDKPVWVANRDNPLTKGSLSIDSNGSLMIVPNNGDEREIFTLYHSGNAPVNTSATLQDDGNFVLSQLNSDGSKGRVLWQSFDYPTDTLLPGMKLGINMKTGFSWFLTSWRSYVSPASGSFMLGIDPNWSNYLSMWWRRQIYWTNGPWGTNVNELQILLSEKGYNLSYIANENEIYVTYTTSADNTSFPRLILDEKGWILLVNSGIDSLSVVSCDLLRAHNNWNGFGLGCAKLNLPECRTSYPRFEKQNGVMSSNGYKFSESENLTLFDCHAKCSTSCSCVAYASVYDDQTGCQIWSSEAIFRKSASNSAHGHEIYLLKKENKWWMWVTIVVGGLMVIPFFCSICYLIWKKCRAKGAAEVKQRILLNELGVSAMPALSSGKPTKNQKKDRNDLCIFSFESIAVATNYFSTANQIGKGGFGPVYKGDLSDGREVAIKRLSRSSGQGMEEFKKETILIAKLQHTNLVRLLGFCIQADEKILVYEYMPNKSLDSFVFDCDKKKMLNWKRRFIIIEGIAQGLLYLHKYSRLRVIHRDLKASNILLDDDMKPKISDFGMARTFELNEIEANTNRVVGTYGYMSPEYAFHGVVSVKTDVFSFGVLILEVVSGRKNSSQYHSEHPLNLTGYAWQLWNEGRIYDLVDPTLLEPLPQNEILRCIHVGLLCVQDHAIDRPSMSDVVSMLSNEFVLLPAPKQPAFFINATIAEEQVVPENKSDKCSINNVSISEMEAR